ncbi:3-oxoacyl-ACP synthase III family protein [Paenibacillus psychroresistens]|uniref:3-oxoacyl-ACP synthase III family protein n=1 Tax=Paenibacillus psychroresistens TaxID=1778678 RepID=UPI001D038C7A|nr:ketoacyl-ACP synthase III [Paenibacillus psychroresistens]
MIKSYIQSIEYYFPQKKEYNSTEDKITGKIGIYERNISTENEIASDFAVQAAEKLFQNSDFDKNQIDYLLYCTQSPDYILPTTACLIQERLKLPTTCGALDFNLGCSGYVYGLSLAKGLIETGIAKNVLLLTADTYSKYIHPQDKSVRVLFGDAGTASLISGMHSETDYIGPFVFGTDGRGANNLIIPAGGSREPISQESGIAIQDSFGNTRSRQNLYMNGPEIFNFTLQEIPLAFQTLLNKSSHEISDYDLFVFHQANKYMLEHLRKKLKIESEKFSIQMEDCGNTVSSTIPIALKREWANQRITLNSRMMLLGFGVGYSWAGCDIVWHENYS